MKNDIPDHTYSTQKLSNRLKGLLFFEVNNFDQNEAHRLVRKYTTEPKDAHDIRHTFELDQRHL